MKLIITFFLSLCAFTLPAQINSDKEIIGSWDVVKFIASKESMNNQEKEKLSDVEDMFLKAKFHFQNDNVFSFEIKSPDLKIKNAHWKIDKQTNHIIIQDFKDKNTNGSMLMEIEIRHKNGKPYFMISETPFILEVKKQSL